MDEGMTDVFQKYKDDEGKKHVGKGRQALPVTEVNVTRLEATVLITLAVT